MAKPFKFRYVNEIVGFFVLLVIAAVIAGIVLAGRAQHWFEPVYHITLKFPSEGSFGLKKGGEVQILETVVGTVDEIAVDEEGAMRARLSIRGNFIRFVRKDSRAIARKVFGLAGDTYIEITKGVGDELSEEDDWLMCEKDTEIIETIEEVLRQVREATLPAIEQVRLAIEEYTKLAAELRDPKGNLQQLLGHLNGILDGLQKGEGTAGQILRDPTLADKLQEITVKIDDSLAEIREILVNVKKVAVKLPRTADTINGEVQDVPGLVLQAQDTLRETEKLILAIQKHWMMRKYVDQTESGDRIPPSAVGAGGGVK